MPGSYPERFGEIMSDPTPTPVDQTATPAPAQPETPQPKPQAPPTAPAPDGQRDAADLGDAGKKAIQRERDAREAAERELKGFRSQIAKAFGVEQDKGEDIVSTLQQRVSAMEKNELVSTVARRHGITEDDDIALLRSQSDEQGMARLAARLKSVSYAAAPTAPAHDPSQGSAPLTPEAAKRRRTRRTSPQKPRKARNG
jgi:hypothetical protein